MTLVIHNIPNSISKSDLLELFTEYSPVKWILLPSIDIKKQFNFAFVELTVKSNEDKAVFKLNGYKWMESELELHAFESGIIL